MWTSFANALCKRHMRIIIKTNQLPIDLKKIIVEYLLSHQRTVEAMYNTRLCLSSFVFRRIGDHDSAGALALFYKIFLLFDFTTRFAICATICANLTSPSFEQMEMIDHIRRAMNWKKYKYVRIVFYSV